MTASTQGTTANGVKTATVSYPTTNPQFSTGIKPRGIKWSERGTLAMKPGFIKLTDPAAPLDAPEIVTIEVKPIRNIYQNISNIPSNVRVTDVRGEKVYTRLDTSIIKESADSAGNTVRQSIPIQGSISLSIPSDVDVSSSMVIELLERLLGTLYASDATTVDNLKRIDEMRRNAITL